MKNNKELIQQLQRIPITKRCELYSFDIISLYTNVLENETIIILEDEINNANIIQEKELLDIIQITLRQIFVQFDEDFHETPTN